MNVETGKATAPITKTTINETPRTAPNCDAEEQDAHEAKIVGAAPG